jgi:hypothetical protein
MLQFSVRHAGQVGMFIGESLKIHKVYKPTFFKLLLKYFNFIVRFLQGCTIFRFFEKSEKQNSFSACVFLKPLY